MICFRMLTKEGTRSLKGVGSSRTKSWNTCRDAPMTAGSLSHSTRLNFSCRLRVASGSSCWKRCSTITAFFRTMLWSDSSSFSTSGCTAGTMSTVSNLAAAMRPAHCSSTLALCRSFCSRFTSMMRRSLSGPRHREAVKYPTRFCSRSVLVHISTALT